ncbi:hypothetical protein QR680_007211 [Steinernema hermaphroditum]|uniref:Uncharacterized protein n=1 Tax=Steinernema hermaphroditum TaxID=289476 RepID=A0AA39HXZ9_9BILA|nr:hypothetical protein QR680_007211 [Steinernema hermaphroditum]
MGIADIGNIWSVYMFHRIRQASSYVNSVYLLFGTHGPLPFMCIERMAFFNLTQKYFLLMIGLNRFAAVVLPMSHKWIWTKKNTLWVILIITGFNVVYVVVLEIAGRAFFQVKNNTERTLQCRLENLSLYDFNLQYLSYLPMFVALATCCIFGIIIYKLVENRQKLKNATSYARTTYKIELRLTICVFIHALLLVVDGGTSVLIFFADVRCLHQTCPGCSLPAILSHTGEETTIRVAM